MIPQEEIYCSHTKKNNKICIMTQNFLVSNTCITKGFTVRDYAYLIYKSSRFQDLDFSILRIWVKALLISENILFSL